MNRTQVCLRAPVRLKRLVMYVRGNEPSPSPLTVASLSSMVSVPLNVMLPDPVLEIAPALDTSSESFAIAWFLVKVASPSNVSIPLGQQTRETVHTSIISHPLTFITYQEEQTHTYDAWLFEGRECTATTLGELKSKTLHRCGGPVLARKLTHQGGHRSPITLLIEHAR